MCENVWDKIEVIRHLADSDGQYRQMQLDMRAIEKKYNEVLSRLSAEDQNAICDFVSQCEGMSWWMLVLACTQGEK